MHLRVWWIENENEGWFKVKKIAKSGIVVSSFGSSFQDPFLLVREDDGTLHDINMKDVSNSEWVNHTDEGN
jgi:hypothetical protein